MPSKCIKFIDPKSILPATYSRLHGIKLSSVQTLPPSDSALAAFEAISIVPDTDQLIIHGKYKSDESQPGDKAAVCKMALSDGGDSDAEDLDALRQELEFYCGRLHRYQGLIVPRLYGGYEGVLESSRATVTVVCLILEDCGVPLTEDLPVKNFDILSQVMEKFLCLHKRAQVSLPDEALEGCLVWQPDSKDSIRVVGFGKAREHDNCKWTEPPHYSLDKYGSWSLFNCKDLYHLSGRIGWLTPGVVWVEGEDYDVTRYHSSEEIIAAPANSFRSNNPMFRRAVFRAVETYNELYGNRKETICQRYHLDKDNWPPKAIPLAEFDSELQNTTQMFGSGLHISESASGVNSQR